MPHPLLARATRTARTCSRPSRQTVRPLPRRPARLPARADAVLRARTSTPTSASRAGSFAPTAVAWGHDNRTCSMRVVGHGNSQRLENRLPGADVNPYLALRGDDRRRPARGRLRAPARSCRSRATPTRPTSRTCRATCTTPRDLFAESDVAREAFGQEVVDHYLNRAQHRARARFESDGDRLGAPPGLRAALMSRRPVDRHQRGGRERALDGLGGRRGKRLAAHVLDRRRRRGRACRWSCPPTTPAPRTPTSCSTCSTACPRRRRRHRPGDLRRRARSRARSASAPSATASSSPSPAGRSSATCRCSASAAARRC